MNQLRKIVVGVDFSRCSRQALAHAVRIARWNDAQLHLIHVIDALVVTDLAEALRAPLAEVRSQAERTAEQELQACLREAGGEATLHVKVGSPIGEILKLVNLTSADLLVVGTNGNTAPHLGAGTLAVQCLRKAPTKVLLVSFGAAGSFRTVAACVDFSPTSSSVIEQAHRVASQEDSVIHYLHVFDPPWERLHYLMPTSEANRDFRNQYLAALKGRLEELAARRGATGVHCALFPHTRYGTGIADYAKQIGADLIVLGTRGRTNLRHVLTGTTAERLLRDLPCSVLAVRAVASEAPDDDEGIKPAAELRTKNEEAGIP